MSELTHIDESGSGAHGGCQRKKAHPAHGRGPGRCAYVRGNISAHHRRYRFQGKCFGSGAHRRRHGGSKKTADLIPMCHPLNLTHAQVDFFPDATNCSIRIEGTARIFDQTGIEMEALTAVSVAALTLYDMCKAIDKSMTITDICLP